MTKRSIIERNKKRKVIYNNRSIYSNVFYKWGRYGYHLSSSCIRNICYVTGQTSSVFSMFQLRRNIIYQYFRSCLLPFFSKASW